MATFDASQATRDIPLDNELGDHGAAFPRGKVIIITTSDTVVESDYISQDQIEGTAAANVPASGSGDFGLAIFRRGKTYTITAGEDTLLTAAGYTTT